MKRLSDAERYGKPSPELLAEIGFLKGVCFEGLGRAAEARAMFQYVDDQYQETIYGYSAREKLQGSEKR